MKENLKYKGVDFSDIESDREFYGCTFEECSFARAKLTNVLFSRCEFIRCDFSLCKIYGVLPAAGARFGAAGRGRAYGGLQVLPVLRKDRLPARI